MNKAVKIILGVILIILAIFFALYVFFAIIHGLSSIPEIIKDPSYYFGFGLGIVSVGVLDYFLFKWGIAKFKK